MKPLIRPNLIKRRKIYVITGKIESINVLFEMIENNLLTRKSIERPMKSNFKTNAFS